jgi:hypothetical protein
VALLSVIALAFLAGAPSSTYPLPSSSPAASYEPVITLSIIGNIKLYQLPVVIDQYDSSPG